MVRSLIARINHQRNPITAWVTIILSFFLVTIVIVYGGYILLTWYPSYNITLVMYIIPVIFLGVNIYLNIFLSVYVDASPRSIILPAVLKPGWKYCAECGWNIPPRASHCYKCNICILKRDHHCAFYSMCIGFRNHRYFIVSIIYLWIGVIYAGYINISYAIEVFGGFTVIRFFCCFIPIPAWMVGYFTAWEAVVGFFCALPLAGTFSIGGLVYYELYLIINGQTWKEAAKNDFSYRSSITENLNVVLGRRWWACFLFPLIPSELDGDGTEFKKASRRMRAKDK